MKFAALAIVFISTFVIATAQQIDTVKRNGSKTKELAGKAIRSVRRSPEPTMFTVKSEDAFIPYEGKIIRKIYYEQLDLCRSGSVNFGFSLCLCVL